ncbi:MAG: SGNH/GDSL hydrolase family protein [Variovorax sp.]
MSDLIAPFDVEGTILSTYRWRFLAEGDSWFSIGDSLVFSTSNLLAELIHELTQHDVIVNCARPGDTLAHMSQMWSDPNFTGLLDGPIRRPWDGILISAGGNDVIDACLVAPDAPPDRRLLLGASERNASVPTPERYISPAGWQLFERYFDANVQLLVDRREASPSHSGNWRAPLVFHTYRRPVVRNVPPVLPGPWLFRAMSQYDVPKADRQALADELFDRLRALLLAWHRPADRVLVFDSARVSALVAADPDAPGASGDWINEIHPTAKGYRKLAEPFAAFIERNMP